MVDQKSASLTGGAQPSQSNVIQATEKFSHMPLKLRNIPAAFHLPRPNWEVIRTWVEGHVAEADHATAWAEIAEDWLATMNEALGDTYRIHRSERILLFASVSDEQAEAMLHYAESGIDSITNALGDLACERWLGPLAILLFADQESYASYTAPLDPEAELIRSAGMCYRNGYVHIAIRPSHPDSLRRTILHELTHACLSDLSLPLWLEEGITQLAEEAAVFEWGQFALTSESAAENRRYWHQHGLSQFWWGEGFHLYDEGQAYSYQLAQILFRLILADHRQRLPDFVRHAHSDDAGESAARTYLGKGLADLAAQFLGQGSWDPVPTDSMGWSRRGSMYLSREQYTEAIADFDEGIRLDPRFALNYAERGLAYAQLGRFEEAIADYERANQYDHGDFCTLSNLAWMHATCRDNRFRNGENALDLATRACELSGFTQWTSLGALAAAYAECGTFDEAVKWARESLRLAPEEEREGCKSRLRLYQEEQPYREYEIPSFVGAVAKHQTLPAG
jgi:tetratricopeptide (TPR) repeat protein